MASHDEGRSPSEAQLVYGKNEMAENGSYKMAESVPMHDISKPARGITVHRGFHQNEEVV